MKDVNVKKIYKVILICLTAALVFYSLIFFLDIFILLSISILIALIFNPIVNRLERFGIKRAFAVLLVFVLVGASISVSMSFLLPKLVNQLETISNNLSQEKINVMVAQFQNYLHHYIPFIKNIDINKNITEFLTKIIYNAISNLSTILTSIFSVIALIVIIPFMTFFILKDTKQIFKGLLNIMPNRYFEMSYWVLIKTGEHLGRFVRGWILDAVLVGTMVAIVLSFLGVQNSISIGFVAGIGHLIPYFGPLIGGVPAIIISLIQFGDFTMLPSILVSFLLIYTIDNGFIQPNIYSKSTDIHPLFIIVLIIMGNQFLGVVGMLLAVPIATVAKTAAWEIYHGYKNYKIIKL
ncbi:MAG: AI-2E family transporter [bacterium]